MARASRSSRKRRLSLDVVLRRQCRTRRALAILGVLLLIALFLADRQGWLLYQGDAMARYDGQSFHVDRVIDGDTLVIAAPDGDEPVTRVRLWGIDTPELARAGQPAEPGADEARRFAERRVTGKLVRLELEPHRVRGSFGRVLAFVYGPDGRMLNEALLSAGLAEADDRWSHRHVERFELLEMQAQRDARGLWGENGP